MNVFHDLKAKSDKTVKDAVLSALVELRQQGTPSVPPDRFEYFKVIERVVARQCGERDNSIARPDNRDCRFDTKLLTATWGLVCEGIIIPSLEPKRIWNGTDELVIKDIQLTELGVRVLTKDTDHPLRPGFLTRLKDRAPNISEEVMARFEDAVTCLEKSVLRAAVVMIGLASEETIRVTHGALLHLKLVTQAKVKNTRDYLGIIRPAIENWVGTDEQRHKLKMALLATDMIREARNKASHPGEAAFEGTFVEDLLVQASHHLPALWEVVIMSAAEKGYSPS